jgi:hypothetical protein
MIKLVQIRSSFLLFLFLLSSFVAFSQKADSLKVPGYFGGSIALTNKGISAIPNLTLGKPAAIFIMSVGRKIRFEPELRFALEGKPWMFIFWWRYDLLNTKKFLIKIRTNASYVFNTVSVTTDSVANDILKTNRTWTSDITTSYFLTKNISIGIYYMYVYGIEKDAIKNTHFISLRAGFSDIRLTKQFYLKFNPQVYYLKMDENDGYYFNTSLTLAKRNFPLSISGLVSRTIQTKIPFGKDFLWNVSLIYSFENKYVEK